jgi:hypothetical protein
MVCKFKYLDGSFGVAREYTHGLAQDSGKPLLLEGNRSCGRLRRGAPSDMMRLQIQGVSGFSAQSTPFVSSAWPEPDCESIRSRV